jgi:integrating conjugative element protein (TIGR03758 family)
MTLDQITAFESNGGFMPSACANLLLSLLFAVLLIWGAWAIRSAYVGWAESQLSNRQLLGVVMRFFVIYLVLSFFLLS